ncbi:hypothetical protein GF356_07495 [candidate division GN15 bacterium]|nr:hypothetical protein [candidate division GN15 bacterium]
MIVVAGIVIVAVANIAIVISGVRLWKLVVETTAPSGSTSSANDVEILPGARSESPVDDDLQGTANEAGYASKLAVVLGKTLSSPGSAVDVGEKPHHSDLGPKAEKPEKTESDELVHSNW